MSKVYKSYELMKAIEDGELSVEQKVNSLSLDYEDCTIGFVLKDSAINLMMLDFELIEDETIDIDSIEEVNHYDVISAVEGKTEENINEELKSFSLVFNKLLKWAKQADKEIKSIKEKI